MNTQFHIDVRISPLPGYLRMYVKKRSPRQDLFASPRLAKVLFFLPAIFFLPSKFSLRSPAALLRRTLDPRPGCGFFCLLLFGFLIARMGIAKFNECLPGLEIFSRIFLLNVHFFVRFLGVVARLRGGGHSTRGLVRRFRCSGLLSEQCSFDLGARALFGFFLCSLQIDLVVAGLS